MADVGSAECKWINAALNVFKYIKVKVNVKFSLYFN
jgi:hypothetical protein